MFNVRTSVLNFLVVTLIIFCSISLLFWHFVFPVVLTLNRVRPNIILIVGDDIGWNDVGFARFRDTYQRSPVPFTPHLDRLASDGVKFEDNYVLPTCTPSRAALHTGTYPYRTGVHGVIEMTKPIGVPLHQRLLPQYLKQLGYSTHLVGKWHLGYCKWAYTPTERGYDSFVGFHGGAEYYYKHNNIVRYEGKSLSGYDFWWNKAVYETGEYSTYLFGNRSLQLIESDEPFFINLSFQTAHAPLEVPDEYLTRYQHLPVSMSRKRFMAMMTVMDEQIGNLVQALRTSGRWRNTVLIFTSDNGGKPSRGGSNHPLRGTKTTLWEGGTRVPAFIVGRDVPRNKIYRGLFHITDWLPTILSMAGGFPLDGAVHNVPDAPLDGVDHWRSIVNQENSPRQESVYDINPAMIKSAIRVGEWKLLVGNPGAHNDWYDGDNEDSAMFTRRAGDLHLFNVVTDPEERVNMTERRPNVVKRLLRRLREYEEGAVMNQSELVRPVDPEQTDGVWYPGWCQ